VTEDQANAVYDVLVKHAGASEAARDEFVFMHVNGRCDEYRFIGSLGFGGKFWRRDWRVSCYWEDATLARVEAIRVTNEALDRLRARLQEQVV
jgi:hypothetical protein